MTNCTSEKLQKLIDHLYKRKDVCIAKRQRALKKISRALSETCDDYADYIDLEYERRQTIKEWAEELEDIGREEYFMNRALAVIGLGAFCEETS